jgi:hypothetical protein
LSAPPPRESRPLGEKLLWFVALWGVGVGAVALVSLLLRFWIGSK